MSVGADRLFRIDTYTSATGVSPSPQEYSLEDLYALLGHEETDCVLADGSPGCRGKKCPQKDGLAWSLGFINDPCRCGSVSRPSKVTKRCGKCGKRTRFAANVAGIDVAVFDIDHIDQQQAEALDSSLEASGSELLLHTTHNHIPPNDQSFRLILPFERTITPEEWKQIWFSIVRKFDLPTVPKHGVDETTRDPARLSFFHRSFKGRPFVNVRQAGRLLDPRELLLENVKFSRAVSRAPHEPSTQPEVGSIDLGSLRNQFRGYDPDDDFDGSKKEIVRRILAEEPLAEKGARGSITLRAGTITGWQMPIDTPFEAAWEILRPSISKIEILVDDDSDENSLEAWQSQVQRGYEGAQAAKFDKIADEESAVGKLLRAKRQRLASQATSPRAAAAAAPAVFSPPAVPVPAPRASVAAHFSAPPMDDDDDGDWRLEKLITVTDKNGITRPKNTAANITVVLESHRAWKNVLRYNELTNEPEAVGGPLVKAKQAPERLITAICDWFVHEEELDIQRSEVIHRIELVARGQGYDPIRSYLTNLAWDGIPRIGDWLIRYCKAKTIDDSGKDVGAYVRMVGEKWLMAGAARGLYPGCKADNVLVFEGMQYVGKSRTLDILGGDWFVDTALNLTDKSTLELASKSWIIELSELAAMKKSETESQKSFFSKRADSFRLSYAMRVGKYPRRCIFAGTTNESKYLLDLTGNRRFWCVWCDDFNTAAIKRDRDQMWAEAVFKVRSGETCPNCFSVEDRCSEHRWWLDKEQTSITEQVAASRLRVEFEDEIRAWWFSQSTAPRYLTMSNVVVDILGLTVDRKEQQQASIGRAMKTIGFEKLRISVPGGRAWAYVPTEGLLKETAEEAKRKKLAADLGEMPDRRSEVFAKIGAARVPQSFAMVEPLEPV